MAWPNDARLTNFSAGMQVPSTTLNEMQDATVDYYRTHYVFPAGGITGDASVLATIETNGYVAYCSGTTALFYMPFHGLRSGAFVQYCDVLYVNSASAGAAMKISVVREIVNFSTPGWTSTTTLATASPSDTLTGYRSVTLTVATAVGTSELWYLQLEDFRASDVVVYPRLTLTRPCTIT